MKSILTTQNLWRTFKSGYDEIHALKGVGIDIKEGSLTILRGRSGSGKTTLINLLGAIDYPSRGEINFDGTDITKVSDTKRDELRRINYGFVFQSGALMPKMNAFENVDFGLRVSGAQVNDREKWVKKCLEIVGLTQRMNHFPLELSGGEVQRVAIARAIVHKPRLIFADEPTAALDTSMGIQVVKIFKDLVKNEGLTVVMTTHDPNMMEIADYVYTLEDGEIIDER